MMMETAVDCQPKETFAMNVHARVSWNLIEIARGHVCSHCFQFRTVYRGFPIGMIFGTWKKLYYA